MILAALVLLPFIGGVISYLLSRQNPELARAFSAFILVINLFLVLLAWFQGSKSEDAYWLIEFNLAWIPALASRPFGASFHLGLDGLSYVLVLLANAISFVAVVNISETPKRHEGLFLFLLMSTVSGVMGILLAIDLLLFFLFWEVMLVPLYFLILLFGEDQRQKAATRFLILTQTSGLFLLLSIVTLYVGAGQNSFAFEALANPVLTPKTEIFVAVGFLFAFLVKLPAIPFHFWMPSIFASAPISALMAGIMIKTSAYSFLRFSKFSFPLFPNALDLFAPYLMVLGVISMIYGALIAYAQTDIKKILAYSTISHVGLILAGLFSQSAAAMTGVAVLLVTQAVSTSALLMICNHIFASTKTREIGRMSGLFKSMPKAGSVTLILVMASIGLPGLGNFVGEWLVLIGIFQANPWIGVLACFGLVFSALYMLRFLHAIFFGTGENPQTYRDISSKSFALQAMLIAILVGIGLSPAQLIDIVSSSWPEQSSTSESIDTFDFDSHLIEPQTNALGQPS